MPASMPHEHVGPTKEIEALQPCPMGQHWVNNIENFNTQNVFQGEENWYRACLREQWSLAPWVLLLISELVRS